MQRSGFRLSRLRLLGAVGVLLASSLLFAGDGSRQSPKVIALVGGRIQTETDAGLVEGTLVIRDGVVSAIGPSASVPADAERIDVTGFTITPGLIDARSCLWLTAAAARESGNDAGLNVLDGIDPHDEDWKEVIRQGVTTVYVQPANTGIFGGRGAVLRVGPAESVEEVLLKTDAGAQAAIGPAPPAPTTNAPANAGRGRGRGRGNQAPVQAAPATPPPTNNALTRFAQYEQIKRALESAKQYDEEWKKREEADKKTAGKSGKDAKAPAASAAKAKRDPTKEFLRKVTKGEVALHMEVHREDEVRNALRLADEFHIRMILEGVSNPVTQTEKIIERRMPLVLGPFVELGESAPHRKDRPADWPRALLAGDQRWALGTFSNQPRGSRLLRAQAAAAVASGLDPDRVLRAMTRDAAEILGVGDQRGQIAAGRIADLVVFAGDPLDPSVPVRLAMSNGKVVYQADVTPAPAVARNSGKLELPARLPKTYALKTQRLVGEDGRCEPGTVLVDGGKIVAMGRELNPGTSTPTYDLGHAVLAPGLVAGEKDLGLNNPIDDPAEADASQVRSSDVYDAQERTVRELLENGFTSALYAPGSINVIAGSASGLRLSAAEAFLGEAGIKFVLGASSRESNRGPEDPALGFLVRVRGPSRYPGSLAGQVELIEQVLSGKGAGTELYVPRGVRQQIQVERHKQIAAVLERKQIAFFEAHNRAEIDAALQLIARFNLRGVLIDPEELAPFVNDIKRLKVGVIAHSVQTSDYDRSALELVAAAKAGVPVAFGSASGRELRATAALAVNAGAPPAIVWQGLTTAAAQMVGLPGNTGRIAVGGPADLVIWDGAPLDLRSRPLRVVVDGKVAYAAP